MTNQTATIIIMFLILSIITPQTVLANDDLLTVFVKPIPVVANTELEYRFDLSNESSCVTVLKSVSKNITTDAYGIGTAQLNFTGLTQVPSHICEYKGGALRATHEIGIGFFQSVRVIGNVTASSFIGDGSALTGISHPADANLTSNDIKNMGFYFDEANLTNDLDDNYVSRNTWTDIDDYPSSCAANTYVQALGDTLTCVKIINDTDCSSDGSCGLITYDSELNYYTDSDISGNEAAFTNWDKDNTDDFTTAGGTINGPVIINGNLSVVGEYVNMTVTNQYLNGSFKPTINSEFNLGSLTYYWNILYANTLIGSLHWSNLTSVPAGLADGDDDTTYTASGTLLGLSGTAFSLSEGTLTDTKWCKYTAGTGLNCNVDPVTDTDTTYTASGTLLGLSGTAFSLSEGMFTDTKWCKYTAGTGLDCNVDPVTDTDTTYSHLSNFTDNIGVSADWDEEGDLPATVTLDAEWNTQGEVETIWGITIATDTELAAQDECSEITGCVENALINGSTAKLHYLNVSSSTTYIGNLIICDNGTATIMTRNATLATSYGCTI